MGTAENGRLDSSDVAALFVACSDGLLKYLRGMLRDDQSAADVMQWTFARLIERGGEAEPEKREAWLYRVATNRALEVLRRNRVDRRALSQAAHTKSGAQNETNQTPAREAVRRESIQRVRDRLRDLPPEQRVVVRLRIYENKKFSEIANQLDLPLGTVLSRMRSAMARVKRGMSEDDLEESGSSDRE